MADDKTDQSPPETGDESQSSDALEAALRERFGDEVTIDTLNEFVKREEGWLAKHNETQKSLAESEREAQEARDQLLQQVAASQAMAQQPSQSGEPQTLSDEQFYAMLGAQGAGDVASAGQLLGVFRGMQNTLQQAGTAFAQELQSKDQKIQELEQQVKGVEPYFEGMHQYLAEQKRDELLGKYKYASKAEVEHALKTLPSGPDFEDQLEQAAAASHKRQIAIAQEVMKDEAARRRAARDAFRGEGAVGAIAGENLPKMTDREGIEKFAEMTFDAGDSEI